MGVAVVDAGGEGPQAGPPLEPARHPPAGHGHQAGDPVGHQEGTEDGPLAGAPVAGQAGHALEDGGEDQRADDVGHHDGQHHHHPGGDQLALVAFDLFPAEGDGVLGGRGGEFGEFSHDGFLAVSGRLGGAGPGGPRTGGVWGGPGIGDGRRVSRCGRRSVGSACRPGPSAAGGIGAPRPRGSDRRSRTGRRAQRRAWSLLCQSMPSCTTFGRADTGHTPRRGRSRHRSKPAQRAGSCRLNRQGAGAGRPGCRMALSSRYRRPGGEVHHGAGAVRRDWHRHSGHGHHPHPAGAQTAAGRSDHRP